MHEAVLDVLHMMLKLIILKANIHLCTLQDTGAIVALTSSCLYAKGLPMRFDNSQLLTAHIFFTSNKLGQIIITYIFQGQPFKDTNQGQHL